MRVIFFIGTFLMLVATGAGGEFYQNDSLVNAAKQHFAKMNLSEGSKALNRILEADSLHQEANYLKAELYLLYGSEKFYLHKDRLSQTISDREISVLEVKEAVFLGLWNAGSLLERAAERYPDNSELNFITWLRALDQGNFDKCAFKAKEISASVIMKWQPYMALFNYARDRGPETSLVYLDSLESVAGTVYHSRNRQLYEILSQLKKENNVVDEYELEYADCGAGMGFYMTDKNGNRIKVQLDTGTSSGLFTIHSDSIGDRLSGEEVLVVEDGIQYNYMNGPEDMIYKLAAFELPYYENFPVGYFKGRFSIAHGCFSPFAFSGYAMSIDPIRKKAFLRSEQALNRYLEKKENYITVDYIVREGWIYIPCKVNGKEVFMMVETGSRDVNLNRMSLRHFNITPYEGINRWNGKDYTVEKIDFQLEIGELTYNVKGGFISDFVLGNTFHGLAAAGDIGPDFFRNFAFTIDPFNKRLIIELNDQGV